MTIKPRYIDRKFIPLEDKNLENINSGEIVELQIIPKEEKISWKGALKHIKKGSVELQHEIKNRW